MQCQLEEMSLTDLRKGRLDADLTDNEIYKVVNGVDKRKKEDVSLL